MTEERNINIKNMCWYVIGKWRLVLACMLFLAVLFTAIQYKKDYSNAMAGQNVVEVTPQQLKDSMSEEEITQIELALRYSDIVESSAKYSVNSILMNIPCDNEVLVTLQYSVQKDVVDAEESLASYVEAYTQYVQGGKLGQHIEEEAATEEQYLTELFEVTPVEAGYQMNEAGSYTAESGFTVTVKHYDLDAAENLAILVQQALEEYAGKLSEKLGDHQLVLVDETIGTVTDPELFEQQRVQLERQENIADKEKSVLAELSQNQYVVYQNWNLLDGNAEEEIKPDETIKETEKISVSISKKMFVLGLIIGFFASVMVLLIVYIGTRRVRDDGDFTALQLNLLGTVADERRKKGPAGWIDAKLRRLHYKAEYNIPAEQRLKMLVSNIYLKCQANGAEQVYLTGTVLKDMDAEFLKQLTTDLKARGIALVIGSSMIESADALLAAAESRSVIIIEKELKTVYESLEKEMKLCQENAIRIIGGILVRA